MNYSINFYHGREERVRDWLSFAALTKTKTRVQNWIQKLSLTGLAVSMLVSGVVYSPDAFYRVKGFEPQSIEITVPESPVGGSFEDKALYSKVVLPPVDPNLPEGRWLVIPKIGVNTAIREAEYATYEEALKLGVWRYDDLGTPEDKALPMVLVAHRFGYLKWSNQYRRQHSFYNLDKLQVGDTFDVFWDQRRLTYEIYAGEEATEISDYSADIILYTCKLLNGEIRILRYARRVEY